MSRFITKNKQEIGLAPDELIFRGAKKMKTVDIGLIEFNSDQFVERSLDDLKNIYEQCKNDNVSWLNIDGLHDMNVMTEIAKEFNFDQLVMAEVLNTDARPKIVDFGNCMLITIKMLQEDEAGFIVVENLSIILTESVIITFQEDKGDVFDPVRQRIRKKKKRITNGGVDYLAFALLDIVVDNYLYVLSLLGEQIESLEEKLLSDPDKQVFNEINRHKRELNFLRKNIKPAKEMILSLEKSDAEFIKDYARIHFKELNDNISQASDSSDSYREILMDQLSTYHSTIGMKLNDIMKFLTVFSVIFIPLTFIAGIYGTNFDNIPELHYRYGYFVMWLVIIVTAVIMLYYFKRKKWL